MSEALQTLMASEHWPYVWPCYALAFVTFIGLGMRAALQLRQWKARADQEQGK